MILFFYGPNSYASRRRLMDMEATYVAKTGSDFGLEHVDGATATLSSLAASLQAVPFLSNSRLVIIEGMGRNKGAQAGIEQIIASVPDTTVVVFYETEVDKRTNYFKSLLKHAKVQNFEKLSLAQLSAWATREITALGGSIDRPALQLLLERTGDDQWRLSQEINKLINYEALITKQNVDAMVQAGFAETIFGLVEAVTTGKYLRAKEIYDGLIEEKTNEIYILSMILWQARNLLMASSAPGLSSAELAKKTGMSPYVTGKMQAAARRFSDEQLRQMMIAAINTEYQIKSGAVPMGVAIERLIYDLSSRSATPSP